MFVIPDQAIRKINISLGNRVDAFARHPLLHLVGRAGRGLVRRGHPDLHWYIFNDHANQRNLYISFSYELLLVCENRRRGPRKHLLKPKVRTQYHQLIPRRAKCS